MTKYNPHLSNIYQQEQNSENSQQLVKWQQGQTPIHSLPANADHENQEEAVVKQQEDSLQLSMADSELILDPLPNIQAPLCLSTKIEAGNSSQSHSSQNISDTFTNPNDDGKISYEEYDTVLKFISTQRLIRQSSQSKQPSNYAKVEQMPFKQKKVMVKVFYRAMELLKKMLNLRKNFSKLKLTETVILSLRNYGLWMRENQTQTFETLVKLVCGQNQRQLTKYELIELCQAIILETGKEVKDFKSYPTALKKQHNPISQVVLFASIFTEHSAKKYRLTSAMNRQLAYIYASIKDNNELLEFVNRKYTFLGYKTQDLTIVLAELIRKGLYKLFKAMRERIGWGRLPELAMSESSICKFSIMCKAEDLKRAIAGLLLIDKLNDKKIVEIVLWINQTLKNQGFVDE